MINKIKIGDKVRFRQDGEIGKHNNDFMGERLLKDEFTVVHVYDCGNVELSYSGGRKKQDWVTPIQIELIPEPQPKFANIKKGDWVELRCGKNYQVKSVDKVYFTLDGWGCDTNARYDFNGMNLYTQFHGNDDIVKILSHKEVIVDFGSGIKGTVEKDSDTAYFLVWHSKNYCDYSMIKWSALDHATRTKVESILKAQEEE